MTSAIELIRSYVIPAYRYSLYELGGSDGREFDKWLVDHIIQISGDTLTVNSTDLRRSARRPLAAVTGNKFVQDELIGDGMHYLERAGYVAQLDESKRGIVTWAIDPRLATLYPEHRLKIIKAKQRQADERHRIVTSNGVDMERRIVRGYKPDMMD
jgi:hypothetical protein